VLYRTTSNVEPHGDRVKSPTSKQPLKPGWPTYTNASLHSGRIGLRQPTERGDSFPPSLGPAITWLLRPCSWMHYPCPLPIGWARCISD
jgi:hypothetical protein